MTKKKAIQVIEERYNSESIEKIDIGKYQAFYYLFIKKRGSLSGKPRHIKLTLSSNYDVPHSSFSYLVISFVILH